MKSILLISCVFPPEPTISGQVVMDLASELSKTHNINVISPRPSRPVNYKFPDEVKKFSFNHLIANSFIYPQSNTIGRFRESYSFGKWCQKYIEENNKNIDVIYHNSWPLFAQYFIVKEAKKYNIPVLTHVQDIYPDSFTNKIPIFGRLFQASLLPLDKYILKNSAKIICISDNMRQILANSREIDDNKFFTVQNWQDENQFIQYSANKIEEREVQPFTFMYLGNNGPVAGVELLISAFAKANIPNSRFIIAGSGSKTDVCKNLVQTLNVGNIEFMPVAEGKVPETQNLADVMLLPVKTGAAMSSIPSKLPAYMFSKKPIIGSLDLQSDTARAINEANCGIVIEPENEPRLIEAMQKISQWSKSELRNSGENGFDYAMKNLSKKSNLKSFVDHILQAAE